MLHCGLLGEKLGHSYSPAIHRELGDYEYRLYEKAPDEVEGFIKSGDIETLDVEVRDHEPRMALDGGADGLDYYRVIARDASMHLKSGGILALEIGCDQADDVKMLLSEASTYREAAVVKDLAGLDRVIIATRR